MNRDAIPSIARRLAGALDAPRAFVEPYSSNGSGRVVALRDRSADDAARVKAWRKHARDGTLPPVLLGWVGGLDAYVVLDGHDRLLAARLERVEPEMCALFGVREDVERWTEADRDGAREEALARYERIFASEARLSDRTRLDADRALASAWSDHAHRRSWTPATFRAELATRFEAELGTQAGLPGDVRAALLT